MKKWYFIPIVLILISNIPTIYNQMLPSRFGLYTKNQAVLYLKTLINENKKFNISFDMPLGRNQGYHYIIDYQKIKQSGNWSDLLIQMRMPPQEGDVIYGDIGISIPYAVRK